MANLYLNKNPLDFKIPGTDSPIQKLGNTIFSNSSKVIGNPNYNTLGGVVVQPTPQTFMGQPININPTPAVNNPVVDNPVVKNNPAVNSPVIQNNNQANQVGTVQQQLAAGNTFNTLTGERINGTNSTPTTPAPGSAASLLGIDTGYNYVGQDGNTYNTVTGLVNNGQQGQVTIDPAQTMKDNLALYQSQIDALNNMYNDQLNQSRITNAPGYQARETQNRLQQIQGGIASSPMGSAQTANVQTANQQEQAQAEAVINAQRAASINSIMGDVRTASMNEIAAKKAAKAKSADEYVKFLNEAPTRQASLLSGAVKKAISLGITPDQMSPEDIKALGGIDEVKSVYNTEKSKIDAEKTKLQLEQDKTKAEINKLNGEEKQKALDRALEQKKIDVSWYNAETSRQTANQKITEKTPTSSEVTQYVNKQMATPEFKAMSKSQKADFILANGGTPSDFGY